MRLLGRCPNCEAEDSVATQESPSDLKSCTQATCENCGDVWEDWTSLTLRSNSGDPLIPVEIEVNHRGAWLETPDSRKIPHVRSLILVLNTALMVHFDLGPEIAGVVDGETIELRNVDGNLGLYDGCGLEENPACQRVLAWYAELLRILFEEELRVGDKSLGRGMILKIDPSDPQCEEKIQGLLYLAIWRKTGAEEFARPVFDRIQRELAMPISTSYIAGLTPDEIVRFFASLPTASA